MKTYGRRYLFTGCMLIALFILWTILIQIVDVQPIGANGTSVGFAIWNSWFHELTGVHMTLYTLTDWLGLVPIFICMIFAGIGFVQLVRRRSLFKVDYDILLLGIYYVIVIFSYLIFEMIPINYRPILIDGILEASYPSSTTLLVLCVMPTLMERTSRKLKQSKVKWLKVNRLTRLFAICFSAFMVLGRLVSGVHWFTDIVGAIILSAGLFYIYKAGILFANKDVE